MPLYTLQDVGRSWGLVDGEFTSYRALRVSPGTPAAITALCSDLAGGLRRIGNRTIRQLPAKDPDFPDLRCFSIQGNPIANANYTSGANDNALTVAGVYEEYDLLVGYRTPPYGEIIAAASSDANEVTEIETATLTKEFGGEVLPIDSKKWGVPTTNTGSANPGPAAITLDAAGMADVLLQLPFVDLTLTRHQVLSEPSIAISDMWNRVNLNPMEIQGTTYAAETLHFVGATSTKKLNNFGFASLEITYRFRYRPIKGVISDGVPIVRGFVGWNREFDPRGPIPNWTYIRPFGGPDTLKYEYDEDADSQTIRGRELRGFPLLFHPDAK